MKANSTIQGFVAFSIMSFITILNTGCSVFGIRSAEEVPYKVIGKDGDKEIRQYPPRIIAKTTVYGDYKKSQEEAFRILANYIFGGNVPEQQIAMTAPVTQERKSNQIAMTAPVTQEKTVGGWTLTFAMPMKYKSVYELPTPIDKRIELMERPGGFFAAIRYTWLSSEKKNDKKKFELLEWLGQNGKYEAIQTPYYAGYDPPWTIPFLRRQEIIVEVKNRKSVELN